MVARIIAATPDGTVCCAKARTPWQPTKNSKPQRAAFSHVRRDTWMSSRPLSEIKIMKDDPAAILTQADAIKAKYTAIFKV